MYSIGSTSHLAKAALIARIHFESKQNKEEKVSTDRDGDPQSGTSSESASVMSIQSFISRAVERVKNAYKGHVEPVAQTTLVNTPGNT